MSRTPDLDSLNPPQREAVTTIDGPLLLLAGAGTGKTRVITFRIAYLIACGIPPENILAVTFTNKAAAEMRERVGHLVSASAAKALTVATFHSFCARLLRRHIHLIGYTADFTIASESYQIGLVRNLLVELGIATQAASAAPNQSALDPRIALAGISAAKTRLQTPDDLRETAVTTVHRQIAEVYDLYLRRMRNMNLLDFDDMLVLVLKIWAEHPDVLELHRATFRYLMIDEYQDTNHVQFQLMATLAGSKPNLCVVGDDDQSIYAWRGADVSNILGFDTQFDATKVIRLEQNYRSTETILNAANHVIAHNTKRHPKRLWSGKGTGEQIQLVSMQSDTQEAEMVVEMIRDRQLTDNRGYGDFAVLYRSNHQSRVLEAAFRKARVPYVIVGGKGFFERKEVLDAISLLQTVQNPRNDLAFLRVVNVPPRGIGDAKLERMRKLQEISGRCLQQVAASDAFQKDLNGPTRQKLQDLLDCLTTARAAFHEPGPLTPKINSLIRDSGYLDGLATMYKPQSDALKRRENVLEFLNAAAEFDERTAGAARLGDYLEQFALADTNDKTEEHGKTAQSVTMMTIHASKGLEFPAVFLVGMEQGLFPHKNSLNEGGIEEERRLFYVAITRAQTELVISYASYRSLRGRREKRRPSVFLGELPEDLVTVCTADDALLPASQDVADDYLERMKAMFAP